MGKRRTARDATMADLKRIYGVNTDREVLRRALELALKASNDDDLRLMFPPQPH